MSQKTTIALIIAVFVLMIDAALYYFKPLGNNFYIISDLAVVVYASAAVAAGFYTAKSKGISSLHKKTLLLIAFGALSWLIGEASWAIQEILLKIQNPFPSIGDAFWLFGYLLVFAGIYDTFQIAKTQEIKIEKIALLLAFMIASLIAVTHIIHPSLADPGLTLLGKIITFAYLFFDLMLVIFITALLYLFYTSKIIQSWIWILISMIFLTLADLLYMGLAGSFVSGSLICMLWGAHYIILSFRLFFFPQTL